MRIMPLDVSHVEVAEELWALQHPAYRAEAALIGVADLPPLQDTVESIQSCKESFLGYRSSEEELVGAVSYQMEREGHYRLCRLMVHPDFFRQGIGSQLIECLLIVLPKKSTVAVTAEIRNKPAIALYERFGFVRLDTYKPTAEITMLHLERSPNNS